MFGFKTTNIPTLDKYQNGLNHAGGNINGRLVGEKALYW